MKYEDSLNFAKNKYVSSITASSLRKMELILKRHLAKVHKSLQYRDNKNV
jgi:hypothetical protein